MKRAMMNDRVLPSLPLEREIPLAILLDGDAMADLLADGAPESAVLGCRVRHVRYRPGEDCAVLYDVEHRTDDQPASSWIHVRSVAGGADPTGGSADDSWVRGMMLAAPLSLPTIGAIGHEFPNDPRLPAIRELTDRDALGRSLADVITATADADLEFTGLGRHLRPIRYKPEGRLVVRCRIRWQNRLTGERTSERCLLRFVRGPGNAGVAAIARQLAALDPETTSFSVPRQLFEAPALGCSGVEWIEGERLSRSLKDSQRRSLGIAAAARTLVSLHDSPVAGLPISTPDDHLRSAAARQQRLTVYPLAIRRLLDESLRHAGWRNSVSHPGQQGFVHGDFHQGQLLLAGDRPYLLDLDRGHHGEVVGDLGNFVAQLELLGLRGELDGATACGDEFVAIYEAIAGRSVDRSRLALWKGLALLELARKELRRLKPNWQERATSIGERALEILSGGRT